MHFLLHFGISIETLKKAFQHSDETIHRKVNEVFDIKCKKVVVEKNASKVKWQLNSANL